MTLLFTDGFDAGDWQGKWGSGSSLQKTRSTTRFSSGLALQTNDSNNNPIYRTITASSKVFMGAAVIMLGYTGGDNNREIFQMLTASQRHLSAAVDSSGFITLQRNGTVIATSSVAMSTTVWKYVEMSATIHPSTGTCVIKVDGNIAINFTGNTSASGTADNIDKVAIVFGQSAFSRGVDSIDDLYVCNDSGSVNNGFLGDIRITTLMPTGTGSSTQFTPTGVANNWDNVNDVPYSAATYNSSSTAGQRDTYAMADATAGYTPLAVVSVVDALKSDAGASSIKPALKSGATVYYGATASLGVAVSSLVDIWQADPATSAAWTVSGINAAEFGAEVV